MGPAVAVASVGAVRYHRGSGLSSLASGRRPSRRISGSSGSSSRAAKALIFSPAGATTGTAGAAAPVDTTVRAGSVAAEVRLQLEEEGLFSSVGVAVPVLPLQQALMADSFPAVADHATSRTKRKRMQNLVLAGHGSGGDSHSPSGDHGGGNIISGDIPAIPHPHPHPPTLLFTAAVSSRVTLVVTELAVGSDALASLRACRPTVNRQGFPLRLPEHTAAVADAAAAAASTNITSYNSGAETTASSSAPAPITVRGDDVASASPHYAALFGVAVGLRHLLPSWLVAACDQGEERGGVGMGGVHSTTPPAAVAPSAATGAVPAFAATSATTAAAAASCGGRFAGELSPHRATTSSDLLCESLALADLIALHPQSAGYSPSALAAGVLLHRCATVPRFSSLLPVADAVVRLLVMQTAPVVTVVARAHASAAVLSTSTDAVIEGGTGWSGDGGGGATAHGVTTVAAAAPATSHAAGIAVAATSTGGDICGANGATAMTCVGEIWGAGSIAAPRRGRGSRAVAHPLGTTTASTPFSGADVCAGASIVCACADCTLPSSSTGRRGGELAAVSLEFGSEAAAEKAGSFIFSDQRTCATSAAAVGLLGGEGGGGVGAAEAEEGAVAGFVPPRKRARVFLPAGEPSSSSSSTSSSSLTAATFASMVSQYTLSPALLPPSSSTIAADAAGAAFSAGYTGSSRVGAAASTGCLTPASTSPLLSCCTTATSSPLTRSFHDATAAAVAGAAAASEAFYAHHGAAPAVATGAESVNATHAAATASQSAPLLLGSGHDQAEAAPPANRGLPTVSIGALHAHIAVLLLGNESPHFSSDEGGSGGLLKPPTAPIVPPQPSVVAAPSRYQLHPMNHLLCSEAASCPSCVQFTFIAATTITAPAAVEVPAPYSTSASSASPSPPSLSPAAAAHPAAVSWVPFETIRSRIRRGGVLCLPERDAGTLAGAPERAEEQSDDDGGDVDADRITRWAQIGAAFKWLSYLTGHHLLTPTVLPQAQQLQVAAASPSPSPHQPRPQIKPAPLSLPRDSSSESPIPPAAAVPSAQHSLPLQPPPLRQRHCAATTPAASACPSSSPSCTGVSTVVPAAAPLPSYRGPN